MQFAYAGVPLSLSLLLNLANRRRIEVSTHQRAMGAVVRVQQQLSQDLAVIEQRLRQVAERHQTEIPTQSQLRLQQLHQLAQHTSDSQARIRDLDDFRLVYQEIVSLQEQHRHVYESLAATIDYLNDSPLPQRVDEIEAAIAQIRRDFGLMNDRLAHSMPIDVTRHAHSDTLEDVSHAFDDLDPLPEPNSGAAIDLEASLEPDLSGDELDRIFELEQQRDPLERRTITLPLEQFSTRSAAVAGSDPGLAPEVESESVSPDRSGAGTTAAPDHDPSRTDRLSSSADRGFAASFTINTIAYPTSDTSPSDRLTTAVYGVSSSKTEAIDETEATDDSDDGIFDADILTDDIADRAEMMAATGLSSDSVVERMPEAETRPRDDRDRLEPVTPEPSEPSKRSTIDLFSPSATPVAPLNPDDSPSASNAIPTLEIDPTIQSIASIPTDSLPSRSTPPISFALTSHPVVPPRPVAINLPAIDGEAIPVAPSPASPIASVPPQDWQRLSTLTDHGDWVSDLVMTPTGDVLISASFDRTIQLWNIRSGASLNVLSEHSSPVCAIALSRDQGWLVSGSWDRTIKIWDLETQTLLETLVDASGVAGSVRSLAVSPNGRLIASGWFDRTIALWDVRMTPKRRKISVNACGSHLAHGGRVDAIAFDPTGTLLASASADGTVKLWSVNGATGELNLLNTFADSADPINAVTFSRDGMALIEANRDRTIRIWDVETGEQLHKLTGHNSSVTALAAHPDGETLMSGSSDGTVRLWHIPTGQPIATLVGSRDAVMSVAVSEDGQVLVSGSADGSIDVWRRWGMAELPVS